jgi:hypothetical protein
MADEAVTASFDAAEARRIRRMERKLDTLMAAFDGACGLGPPPDPYTSKGPPVLVVPRHVPVLLEHDEHAPAPEAVASRVRELLPQLLKQ